jgi:hypothetical protein
MQSNVRAVPGRLPTLDEVLLWLLPKGHLARQGDVGIYRRHKLPLFVREVTANDYPQRFAHILGRRHRFSPAMACRYFKLNTRCYVLVESAVNLMHPEHAPVRLSRALYQIRSARGRVINALQLRSGTQELIDV